LILVFDFAYSFFTGGDKEPKLLTSISIVHEDERRAHENGAGNKEDKDEDVEHHALVLARSSNFFNQVEVCFWKGTVRVNKDLSVMSYLGCRHG
jgi:hypothetical protein